jgi:peptide/nickel transport system permease protein
MPRYLLGRLLQAVFVLWAAFTVTFVVLYVLPGDPVEIALGAGGEGGLADQQQVAALRAQYGLDKPLIVQYFAVLGRFLRGDLGNSIATGAPVSDSLSQALPQTLALAGLAFLLAVVLGAGTAILATYSRSRTVEHFLLALPPLGVAIPTFWSGLLLLQVFSFHLHWFPSLGNKGFASLVLPMITLALPNGAYVAQVLSRSLRNTLRQPYIQTARARGASRSRVHLRHALRNAVIPAVTVFSRVGIGRLTQSAVAGQDIPVVQALVLLAAAIFVVVNLVVDLVYPLIDPRIARRAPRRRERREVAVHV